MTTDHKTAEHIVAHHEHGTDCGHEAVKHEENFDFIHDGHQQHGHEHEEH